MVRSKVFISYAHEDGKEILPDLLDHLKHKRIEILCDKSIVPGERWNKHIAEWVQNCDIAILLISNHFIASDFIKDEEVTPLLERWMRGEVKLIPLLISDCLWQEFPGISHVSNLSEIQLAQKPERDLKYLRANDESAFHRVLTSVAAQVLDSQAAVTLLLDDFDANLLRPDPERKKDLVKLVDRAPQRIELERITSGLLTEKASGPHFFLVPSPNGSWPKALVDRYVSDIMKCCSSAIQDSGPIYNKYMNWPFDPELSIDDRTDILIRDLSLDLNISEWKSSDDLNFQEKIVEKIYERKSHIVYSYEIFENKLSRHDLTALNKYIEFWRNLPPAKSSHLVVIFLILRYNAGHLAKIMGKIGVLPEMQDFESKVEAADAQTTRLKTLSQIEPEHLDNWLEALRSDVSDGINFGLLEKEIRKLRDTQRRFQYRMLREDLEAAIETAWTGG